MKNGQYYYRPHRSSWGVFKAVDYGGGVRVDEFVTDCYTKEEAEREVYSRNGWKPKQ